jgi:hypothetical protein
MNKLIETLAALVLSGADTKITRLDENTYKLKSDYGYNDGYFQYDVHYYDWMIAEVGIDGTIWSAVRKTGSDFWNGGGELSEERVVNFGDPEWELPNEAKEAVLKNEEKILALQVGEFVEFDRDGNHKIEYVSASAGRIGLQK